MQRTIVASISTATGSPMPSIFSSSLDALDVHAAADGVAVTTHCAVPSGICPGAVAATVPHSFRPVRQQSTRS
jgi:hypothetical protein